MDKEMYHVQDWGYHREYPKGTTYLAIAKEYQKDYEDDIVLVVADGKLQELGKELSGDCVLRFETTGSGRGTQDVYAEHEPDAGEGHL